MYAFMKKTKQNAYIEHRAGCVLHSRQLLQVLVEQLKQWQVEQTDPRLLILKHSHGTHTEKKVE